MNNDFQRHKGQELRPAIRVVSVKTYKLALHSELSADMADASGNNRD